MIAGALLLLIVSMVAPAGLGSFAIGIAKLTAIGLLGYTLVTNSKETTKLLSSIPDIFTSGENQGIRNNAIISYILSGAMAFLILYIIFTFFG